LFGNTNNATISDFTLANSVITGTNNVGGIVGTGFGLTLDNVKGVDLTVSGSQNVGGLVGDMGGGSIIQNAQLLSSNPNNISVDGGFYVGSIVGQNAGTVSNAFSNATVRTSEIGGGLVGWNNSGGNISDVMYSGNTIANPGAFEVGGLVGLNSANIGGSALAVGKLTNNGAATPSFATIASNNTGTITSPVYYSTTTYGGSTPGIFSGAGAPDFAGAIVGLPSKSLVNPTTLGLSGAWQSNNQTLQFASLTFCGNSCVVNFAFPPPPPPPAGAVTSTLSILNNSNPTGPAGDLGYGSQENVAAVPTSGDPDSDTVVVTVTPDKPGAEHLDPNTTAKLGEKIARDRMCH